MYDKTQNVLEYDNAVFSFSLSLGSGKEKEIITAYFLFPYLEGPGREKKRMLGVFLFTVLCIRFYREAPLLEKSLH
jgi:hypothetical protein